MHTYWLSDETERWSPEHQAERAAKQTELTGNTRKLNLLIWYRNSIWPLCVCAFFLFLSLAGSILLLAILSHFIVRQPVIKATFGRRVVVCSLVTHKPCPIYVIHRQIIDLIGKIREGTGFRESSYRPTISRCLHRNALFGLAVLFLQCSINYKCVHLIPPTTGRRREVEVSWTHRRAMSCRGN